MGNNNLFKILRQSRELVSHSGEWGLFKTVLTIEEAVGVVIGEAIAGKYITIPVQALLPSQVPSKYISLATAQRLSKLSKKQLIELCSRKIIAAKKENGELMILKKSLERYLKS